MFPFLRDEKCLRDGRYFQNVTERAGKSYILRRLYAKI